jgi:hypothetical protein
MTRRSEGFLNVDEDDQREWREIGGEGPEEAWWAVYLVGPCKKM